MFFFHNKSTLPRLFSHVSLTELAFFVLCSGTHEKEVLEAGILEKIVNLVIVLGEKDKDNVEVCRCKKIFNQEMQFMICIVSCSYSAYSRLVILVLTSEDTIINSVCQSYLLVSISLF